MLFSIFLLNLSYAMCLESLDIRNHITCTTKTVALYHFISKPHSTKYVQQDFIFLIHR
ncbi:hypothetical protein V6Z12_A03G227200 [Gossypium hirsutum]